MSGFAINQSAAPEPDLLRKLLRDYGVDSSNDAVRSEFVERHLELLESSQSEVAARTGFVLKRTYEGFGVGYKVPLAVLAIGRAMIGVDLAVSAPFIASNPVAFTCAAVGAVYYGYNALNESEKLEIGNRVAKAFGFGVELVSSLVRFCIDQMASVFDKDMLRALKESLSQVAAALGLTVYEITGALRDRFASAASTSYDNASWLLVAAAKTAASVTGAVSESGRSLIDRKDTAN